ncbi:MAG: CoA ester lyase [Alphaproteobacteria bacterium]|jgi:citrate lyase subunit beta/citryl-CoA lyase|nr:CoA ester lyase [Alphaproteobacteria bacterium]
MTEMAAKPVWRSMLYVPANVERFVDKAHTRGADAVIVDLEDSVLPAEKPAARKLVPDVAAKVSRNGADVLVRINRPWRLAIADLEAVISPAVAALVLPKVADASHIRAIAEIVDELEAERGMAVGHTRFFALIETADALFHAREIAGAHPRMVGLSLGSEDFALDCGMAAEPDGLFTPTMECVFAAHAAGILALGFIGSLADYGDLEAFRGMVQRARRLGFEGASCIHPAQVPLLNEAYGPTADEIDYAHQIIEGDRAAKAEGRGSFEIDGKMIDIPIVDRAERLLARQARIEARLAKSGGGN